MIRYKDFSITRKGKCIQVNEAKAKIVEGDYLYETDRAGIRARGGARGLYKLLKEAYKNQDSEFHTMMADSIINKILEVGK